MRKREVKIELINESSKLPEYATENSFGADLFADISASHILLPGQRVLIPTGVKLALPDDCEGAVRPKSGLALKHGITVLNAPGTIDADYRGEVGVILINHSETKYSINPGEKIAQICFNGMNGIFQAIWVKGKVNEDETERGAGGFGHTGNV